MTLSSTPHLVLPVGPRDHVQGLDDAPVTLLEYGDYECPYCGAAYYVIKEIQRRMDGDFRFTFRNFPLSEIHPHAELAAEAAEAAGGQGVFWEMHDLLFEHQDALDPPDLVRYAQALGLEIQRFKRDLAEHVYAPRVREDFLSGVRSGVNGTPAFYLNGRRHDGSYDLPTLLGALERAAAEV